MSDSILYIRSRKSGQSLKNSRAWFARAKTVTVFACVLAGAVPSSLLAQKGGNGGGGNTPPPQYEYTLTPIYQPGGTYRNVGGPADINNDGRMVGFAGIPDKTTWIPIGCLWEPSGETIPLPPLNSRAGAISDTGLINGHAVDSAGLQYAVWWEASADGYVALDWNLVAPESITSRGLHLWSAGPVSDDGLYVVFHTQSVETSPRTTIIAQVVYDEGKVVAFEEFAVIPNATANEINHDGQGTVRVVGWGSSGIAFYWKHEGDVATQVFSYPENGYTTGSAVNRLGQIVGSQGESYSLQRAKLWDDAQLWSSSTDLYMAGTSVATGINDLGFIVGSAAMTYGRTQETRAFVWENDGRGIRDLNLLAPVGKLRLHSPRKINNQGQILVRAEESRLSDVWVLLTPVNP